MYYRGNLKFCKNEEFYQLCDYIKMKRMFTYEEAARFLFLFNYGYDDY